MQRFAILKLNKQPPGAVLTYVLVFTAAFLIILTGLIGLLIAQHRLNQRKVYQELAFQIAEAGLNYYKWHLAHWPETFSDTQEYEFQDPQGSALGVFRLEVSGQEQCGKLMSINITSTGWTYEYPQIERQLQAQYSRPSIAEYAYIINDNVWAGADREIKGKYHSNGGIRMDGETDSLVASATAQWYCTPSFGCADPYEIKPGIFGAGDGQEEGLWQFPVEPIDFLGITLDLAQMKTSAQTSGLYLAPEGRGYHVIFKNNSTLDIYVINSLGAVVGYNLEEGWHYDHHTILSETFKGNYALPSGCGLVFIEDDLWVEGEVKGKTTIVSADLEPPISETSVVLVGNIVYTTRDGSDGLAVVGQHDVLIPLYSPDKMELAGIFLAQSGHFGRNHYSSSYSPYHKRAKLEMYGSVISKGRVGTKWSYYDGTFASGYEKRENTYDRKLTTSPPPLLPYADDEYRFVKWQESE